MSLFEFLMVLVSMIVGLGVAEILTGIARLIRRRNFQQGYWLHWCGIALVFVALLQNWWELWDLSTVAVWSFPALALMLISPASLYLIAHLIFPDPDQDIAIEVYYHGQMRPIWWLGVVTALASTAFRPLAFGAELLSMDNSASVLLVLGFVALAVSDNRRLHAVLVPLFLLFLVIDVMIWHPTTAQPA